MSSTSQTRFIALVDCNNFYASCERFINPALIGKPVAVLSNNDGCIVARSNELKALGVPMGAPYFKYKQVLDAHNVAVLSSNYTLYADLSKRVMDTIAQFTPELEIYSVDEAFLTFYGSQSEVVEQAHQLKRTILKWTGIPVSVGIAPTKTLAKVANFKAKKDPALKGVNIFAERNEWESVLAELPISEIWGVGRQITKRLNSLGIYNALQLSQMDDERARKEFNVVLVRSIWELRGKICLEIEEVQNPRKSIISSRSFGRPVTTYEELSQSVAAYMTRAAEKMRRQGLVTQFINVGIMTNRFKPDKPQYYNSQAVKLPVATDYTPDLIRYAQAALKSIFRAGFEYKKSYVMLNFLTPKEQIQTNLLSTRDIEKEEKLMNVMDGLNHRFGSNTLKLAASGLKPKWVMKSEQRSKRATTNWEELIDVKAD